MFKDSISLRLILFTVLFGCSWAGCSEGPRYVPVSGVVTLNGKPKEGVIVTFQPLGTAENADPGRGSYGHTDAEGRFVLSSQDGQEGAVVGKHRVQIVTPWDESAGGFDPEVGSPDGLPEGAVAKIEVDPIPPEWNTNSEKEFDVPMEGTDQANFAITIRR